MQGEDHHVPNVSACVFFGLRQCFRVFGHSHRVTWSAAKLKCDTQGGVLAVVSNLLEQGGDSRRFKLRGQNVTKYK